MFCVEYPAYVSKHNVNREKQVSLLMIPNGERLPALLRKITSKRHGDFCDLNCLHSFWAKNRLESHKKIPDNNYFYNTVMPFEDTEILEYNQYKKSDKAPFIIYTDLEFFNRNNW